MPTNSGSSDDRPPFSLKVLHPCTRSWDSLQGDNRRRYCDDCNLHVWNASELTENQARDLLAAPGRVCMGGMAKADGLLLTKERLCEEAKQHLRRRPLLRIAAALGLISIPTALAACAQRPAGDVSRLSGKVAVPSQQNTDPPLMRPPGDLAAPPPPVLHDPPRPIYPGEMRLPTPPPPTNDEPQ